MSTLIIFTYYNTRKFLRKSSNSNGSGNRCGVFGRTIQDPVGVYVQRLVSISFCLEIYFYIYAWANCFYYVLSYCQDMRAASKYNFRLYLWVHAYRYYSYLSLLFSSFFFFFILFFDYFRITVPIDTLTGTECVCK